MERNGWESRRLLRGFVHRGRGHSVMRLADPWPNRGRKKIKEVANNTPCIWGRKRTGHRYSDNWGNHNDVPPLDAKTVYPALPADCTNSQNEPRGRSQQSKLYKVDYYISKRLLFVPTQLNSTYIATTESWDKMKCRERIEDVNFINAKRPWFTIGQKKVGKWRGSRLESSTEEIPPRRCQITEHRRCHISAMEISRR